jgi:leucine dehydrogenase
MIDVFKQKEYSFQISSRKQNSIGPQEAYTAYGVYLALKEVLNFHFGSGRLVGKKVVVDGGGSVGYALITKYLSEEIEEIYVAESDEVSIEKLRASLPGRIHILNPEKVLSFDGDILVPCAEGGILDESGIDGISYSAILGGVDNILKADTEEEEIELANILASKGIFYQVDWLHNSGGLISALEAYINQGLENLESVRKHVEKVCRDSVRDNLYAARVNGVTPTEQAYQDYESMIYPSV